MFDSVYANKVNNCSSKNDVLKVYNSIVRYWCIHLDGLWLFTRLIFVERIKKKKFEISKKNVSIYRQMKAKKENKAKTRTFKWKMWIDFPIAVTLPVLPVHIWHMIPCHMCAPPIYTEQHGMVSSWHDIKKNSIHHSLSHSLPDSKKKRMENAWVWQKRICAKHSRTQVLFSSWCCYRSFWSFSVVLN